MQPLGVADASKKFNPYIQDVAMRKFLLLFFLAGCASTGVIPVGSNTYMVSKQTASGFQTAVGIKAEILKEANEFCEKRGLRMMVVSLRSKDGEPGRSYGTAELVFKAIKESDPEYQNYILQRDPDKIIEIRDR